MSVSSIGVPKFMEKKTQDVYNETWGSARDIGYIRKDYTRISVVSSLTPNDDDSTDWYKFFVQSKGDLTMSVKTDAETDLELDPSSDTYFEDVISYFSGAGLTIELYEEAGGRMNVIASNDSTKEEAFANFENLVRGKLDTQRVGQYYVKVSTENGEIPKENINYILQFQMGTEYKQDFATVESALNLSESDKASLKQEVGYSMFSEEVQGLIDSATTNALIMEGQAAATILSDGATSMTNLIEANKKGEASIFSFTL